jgi:DNA-binding response OmpR family regulator
MSNDIKDKILLVEDEEDTKMVLTRLLRKSGYEVETAKNGYEALEVLKRFKPHIILADWTMPEMDGVELLNILRNKEEYKSIYYIILTARATLRDKIEGLDTGADDFLVKPTDNQELLARIRAGIRITKLQQELKEAEHNKALVEMAFTTGHQINNPLASLTLSLENLKSELTPEEIEKIRDEIAIMEESVKRIKKAVDSLIHLKDPELTNYTDGTHMLKL